jgi:hypothetical protein
MDTKLLVTEQIDDGKRIVDQLMGDEFEVSAAFWAKTAEEGLWYLYIASPLVEANRPGEAYPRLYASISQIPGLEVQLSDIKLINDTNPIARDIIEARNRYPRGTPTRYRGKRVGNVSILEAYVYPPAGTTPDETAIKHGARVYLLDDGVAVVKQTIKRGIGHKERYVIDDDRERHVDPGDDAALGAAVRAALQGRL